MAIGIFDFGLGGLTDFDAISKRLPDVPWYILVIILTRPMECETQMIFMI